MKKIHRILALLMAALMAFGLMTTAFAEPIIDTSEKASLSIYKYDNKAVCTDRIDLTAGEIMKPDQVLIIEVKRGGFEITDDEVNQVEFYVRQIRKSAVLHSSATIDAYVVGATLGDIDPEKNTSSGRIHAVTYGQLVDTASGKLFRLRDRLKEHYDSLGQESIVEQALKESKQLKIDV